MLATASPIARCDHLSEQKDYGEIHCTMCGSTIAVVAVDEEGSGSCDEPPQQPVKKPVKAKPPPPVKQRTPRVKPGQLRFKAVRHVTRLSML